MGDGASLKNDDGPDLLERESLCFSCLEPADVLHKGSHDFREGLRRLYHVAENNALEELVRLKQRLRSMVGREEFWQLVAQGMSFLTGSQYAFISKRILVDDQDVPVEMPPIGEPGSCLMAVAFYFNDGHGQEQSSNSLKYHAYGCPCAYMRHDKVFIIPSRLDEFIKDNPNKVATPAEAYIGVPLFAEGKCFGHFGVMWTPEGASKLRLGWGFIELLLHSLEDLILEHMLPGGSLLQPSSGTRDISRVVPHEAVTVTQSLKPYARNLSHELRTPMQGVVGMLDIMHATVQEAAEGQTDSRVRAVFQTLSNHIEIVQDSSRRAVEAADNVIHAYDMDLTIPENPISPRLEEGEAITGTALVQSREERSYVNATGSSPSDGSDGGRKRQHSLLACDGQSSKKRKAADSESVHGRMPQEVPEGGASLCSKVSGSLLVSDGPVLSGNQSPPSRKTNDPGRFTASGLRCTNLRGILRYVVNESLKVGGRPESAIARETTCGEIIEVMTQSPSGEPRTKIIEWAVDSSVPEEILGDEKDLGKMISCVFLNAIKFTEEGYVTVKARSSTRLSCVVITVEDTGSGIPAAFQPRLFKAFSRQDDSLTRQSEGLGLGLMVAKGVARKLGGDLLFIRSDTSGPNKGTEFEMRVPLIPRDDCSESNSPFGSPALATKSRPSSEVGASVTDARSAQSNQDSGYLAAIKDSLEEEPRNSLLAAGCTAPDEAALLSSASCAKEARRHGSTWDTRQPSKKQETDHNLARRYPLTFLVVEDNKINRKLLVSMLHKLGYRNVYEAYDGAEAVRQMELKRPAGEHIDVVLMDLWMPSMDGYEAAERILQMDQTNNSQDRLVTHTTILAVTADVTENALERAAKAGMKGFMTKPYSLLDLERLILEHCLPNAIGPAIVRDPRL